MDHTHKYVLAIEDNRAEMICSCGKYLKSVYKGTSLVDYEVEDNIERGTE